MSLLTLEETCRLVEGPLETIKQMHIEFLGLMNILTNTLQDDHFCESLHDVGFCRHEDPGSCIAVPKNRLIFVSEFEMYRLSLTMHLGSYSNEEDQ